MVCVTCNSCEAVISIEQSNIVTSTRFTTQQRVQLTQLELTLIFLWCEKIISGHMALRLLLVQSNYLVRLMYETVYSKQFKHGLLPCPQFWSKQLDLQMYILCNRASIQPEPYIGYRTRLSLSDIKYNNNVVWKSSLWFFKIQTSVKHNA